MIDIINVYDILTKMDDPYDKMNTLIVLYDYYGEELRHARIPYFEYSMDYLLDQNYTQIIPIIHRPGHIADIDKAAVYGLLDVIKFYHTQDNIILSYKAMNQAAKNGIRSPK